MELGKGAVASWQVIGLNQQVEEELGSQDFRGFLGDSKLPLALDPGE